MNRIVKRIFAVLAILVCISLCLSFVGCSNDSGDGEESENVSAADSAADTESEDSTGDDKPQVEVEETSITLNNRTKNVYMLNGRDTAGISDMTCDFIGSGIAFRLDNAGGDVRLNLAVTDDCTFLVKVDGAPFNIKGKPYVVATQSGKMAVSGLPTGLHDIELVKVSGYSRSRATLYRLSFFGTLVERNMPSAKDYKVEIIDENALNVAVTDGRGATGTDATLSYAALFDSAYVDVSMLDFGNAGLLVGEKSVLDRYKLRSPDRSAEAYDFAAPADLVIVNVGTVDYAAAPDKSNYFEKNYRSLLNLIREKNGADCRILCLYPSEMGYGAEIRSACDSLGGSGEGLYSQAIPAAYLADGVLSAAELAPMTDALEELINRIIKDKEQGSGLVYEESGKGMQIDYRDYFEVVGPRTEYFLNSNTEGIKILGSRYLESDSRINLDWSCAGVEMVVNNLGRDITFKIVADFEPSYYRAYVDGVVWKNNRGSEYFLISSASNELTLSDVPLGEHTLRIIKATGYTLSRSHVESVTFCGTILADRTPADKALHIEYVGDSISCGWGVIGNHSGAYTDQDGTMAYPYMIADALDADYTITALSGHGLICGNPDLTNGYLYSSPWRDSTEAGRYGFERKADLVIINIGTNDVAYNVGESNFRTAYLNFLNTVREKNPDCKIVCVYNMMNDTYASAILEAVESFGGEANGVYVWKAERTSGHPSAAMHAQYTEELLSFMSQKGIVADS